MEQEMRLPCNRMQDPKEPIWSHCIPNFDAHLTSIHPWWSDNHMIFWQLLQAWWKSNLYDSKSDLLYSYMANQSVTRLKWLSLVLQIRRLKMYRLQYRYEQILRIKGVLNVTVPEVWSPEHLHGSIVNSRESHTLPTDRTKCRLFHISVVLKK